MTIAAVLDDEQNTAYKEMGCKDSKMLTRKVREELAEKIRKTAKETRFVEIKAKEIDDLRKIMSLNEVEAKKMAELVLSFDTKPEKIIVDCPDTDPRRFVQRLHKYLGTEYKIVAEHKADVTYPICSAASIVAKYERDEGVKKIEKKYGDVGSGYPADPATKKFLESYFKEHGHVPPEARKSWETSKRLEDSKKQAKLGDF